MMMRKSHILLISLIALTACKESTTSNETVGTNSGWEKTEEHLTNESTGQKESEIPNDEERSSTYSYRVVFDETTLWGYELFEGSKLMIRQTNIPSIPGTKGFSSREKAIRAAEYILNKLENGIFPPSMTRNELDSLDLLD